MLSPNTIEVNYNKMVNNCETCGALFKEGVQCGNCKKWFDFGCANVFQTGWNMMSQGQRAEWNCYTCKNSRVPNRELLNLSRDIYEMKKQLLVIPSLISDVEKLQTQLNEMKRAYNPPTLMNFFSYNMSNQLQRDNMLRLNNLHASINTMSHYLSYIFEKIGQHEVLALQNNVEIKGITQKNDENLYEIIDAICRKINCSLLKTQINFVKRIPAFCADERYICVGFVNLYAKQEFMMAARRRIFTTKDLDFDGPERRIRVVDNINNETKYLLMKTKIVAKKNNYRFVWVKNNTIHVRKNINSKIIQIRQESDLYKIH